MDKQNDNPQESPINPGEGFRLLVDGDLITDKAQVWACGEGPWEMAGFQGEGHDAALMHPMREPIRGLQAPGGFNGLITECTTDGPQATESTGPAPATGPEFTCVGCGNSDPAKYRTVQSGGYDAPPDFDIECDECGSNEFEDSPKEALKRAIEQRDAAFGDTEESIAYLAALRSSLTQAREALHAIIEWTSGRGKIPFALVSDARAALSSLDGKALEVGK